MIIGRYWSPTDWSEHTFSLLSILIWKFRINRTATFGNSVSPVLKHPGCGINAGWEKNGNVTSNMQVCVVIGPYQWWGISHWFDMQLSCDPCTDENNPLWSLNRGPSCSTSEIHLGVIRAQTWPSVYMPVLYDCSSSSDQSVYEVGNCCAILYYKKKLERFQRLCRISNYITYKNKKPRRFIDYEKSKKHQFKNATLTHVTE